jgi:citrate lyase subunit gamma (acyl carrier protein)
LIVIEDKGALDYAIRARVQTAVLRGAACKELNWEQLS